MGGWNGRLRNCLSHPHAVRAVQANGKDYACDIKRNIRDIIEVIGQSAALLPGSPVEKGKVMELIGKLMAAEPLVVASDSLEGDWDLVFTSNGTVVTRTAMIQAIDFASSLPGTGINRIHQTLEKLPGNESLRVLNEAVLGIGPLGKWCLGIRGEWVPISDDKVDGAISHLVKFEGLAARAQSWLGMELPDFIPGVSLNIPEQIRGDGATWTTTYCDNDLRIGRGSSSGNVFVFFKSNST